MHSHAQMITDNFVQLILAAKAGDLNEVMRLVLQEGAKPDDILVSGKSILDEFYWGDFFNATSDNHQRHQIVIFLIQQGALNNHYNLKHVKTKIPINFNALTYSGTKNLLQVIIDFTFTLNHETLPLSLKRLAITCATVLKAPTTLANIVALPCHEEAIFLEQARLALYATNTSTQVICQKQLACLSNSQQLCDVFSSIGLLFQNTALCISLLEELDAQLAHELAELGVDISSHLQTEYYFFNNHAWPLPCHTTSSAKTYGVLNKLLLAKERQHGINQASHAPIVFADFIEDTIASSYIASGHLFNDATHAGNRLHGKYTHRLQWHIIVRAIELGYIDTKGHSTLTLLRESPTIWLYLFDGYQAQSDQPHPVDMGFCSPYFMHSTLLLTPSSLPNLSAFLRKTFFQSMPSDIATFIQSCSEHDMLQETTPEKSIEEHYQTKRKAINLVYRHQNSAIFFKLPKITTATKEEKQLSSSDTSVENTLVMAG